MSQTPPSIDQLLRDGYQALRAGERERARALLGAAVRSDPQNERAWLFLAGAVTDPQQRRTCLERALAINPASEQARRGLQALAQSAEAAHAPAPQPVPTRDVAPPPAQPAGSLLHRLHQEAPAPAPNSPQVAPQPVATQYLAPPPAAAHPTPSPPAAVPPPPPAPEPAAPAMSPLFQRLLQEAPGGAAAVAPSQPVATQHFPSPPIAAPPTAPSPPPPAPAIGTSTTPLPPVVLAIPVRKEPDRLLWAVVLALGLVLMLSSGAYMVALLT